MKYVILFMCCFYLCISSNAFSNKTGNFSIDFPIKPTTGKIKHPQAGIYLITFSCYKDSILYGLIYIDYPKQVIKSENIVKNSIKGYLLSSNATVIKKENYSLDNLNGVEITYKIKVNGNSLLGIRRFLLVYNRMFTYYAVAIDKEDTERELRKFLDSFKILKK